MLHRATNHIQQESYFVFQRLDVVRSSIFRVRWVKLRYVVRNLSYRDETLHNSEKVIANETKLEISESYVEKLIKLFNDNDFSSSSNIVEIAALY